MILLRSDCLEFELSNGEKIPCSAEVVTLELLGSALEFVERHVIENAAAAVLHYFRHELGKTSVTLGEFTAALESALRALGLNVVCESNPGQSAPEPQTSVAHSDLRVLASQSGKCFELGFFSSLRLEMQDRMRQAPDVMRFFGLRGCVKQMIGARRWSPRCQQLSDHIVDYLRGCLARENSGQSCHLLVM